MGIDTDTMKLALAGEAAAERGLVNLEFRVMNVYEWVEPESYDVVYCRFLLQHLSRPVDVLRTMWRALGAGGTIIVEDADFEGSFCDAPNAGFAFWVDTYQRVLERHGGHPQLGRKLHRLFPAAGIPAPAITLAQRTDSIGKNKPCPIPRCWQPPRRSCTTVSRPRTRWKRCWRISPPTISAPEYTTQRRNRLAPSPQ